MRWIWDLFGNIHVGKYPSATYQVPKPEPTKNETTMLYYDFDKGRAELFKNGYTQAQVDSINAIVDEANMQGISKKEHLAYILATAYHECHDPRYPDKRITPMKEFGGMEYLKKKSYYPYYGRGFVQLTWKENYAKYKALTGKDLVKNPDLALDMDTAAFVIVHGMKYGTFTGKKLSDYIKGEYPDYQAARRIINGTDKAYVVAGYAFSFGKCIGSKTV